MLPSFYYISVVRLIKRSEERSNEPIRLIIEPANRRQKVEATAPSILTTIREWAEMIKIEHTVFALPFALSGLILALPGWPHLSTCFWTIVAFAGARSAAMTLNRLIDAEIDARNPRTAGRAIPAGKISRTQAWLLAVASFGV